MAAGALSGERPDGGGMRATIVEPGAFEALLHSVGAGTIAEGLLDTARAAIFVLDPQGRIVCFNRYTEELTGYRLDEVRGRDWFTTFLPQRDRPPTRDLFARAINGSPTLGSVNPILTKDGREVQVEWYDTVLRDPAGQAVGLLSIGHDVTARLRAETAAREAERALGESEARFRAIFEQAAVGVAEVDLNTRRFVRANRKYCDIVGRTEEELLDLSALDLTHPEDVADDAARMQELAEGRSAGFTVEKRYLHRDGSIVWVELSVSRLSGLNEPAGHYIATEVDITERRRAEQIIALLNREQRDRLVELDALNKELESFSYSVSHDLRAPLRAMDGFSRLVLEDYAALLDEKGQHYLERIRTASQTMGQLIDDLLNLSRITRDPMRREPVDLSKLAREVADALRMADPQRVVEFSIADGVAAYGDVRLLRIALENLLGNAWKFTGTHPTALIEFGVAAIDGEDAYFVRDDGAGLDMAYADKLFAPFRRLHTTAEFPGTGVGLATVQRVIHRHGGRAWAEGEVERGATFYFTLPAQD